MEQYEDQEADQRRSLSGVEVGMIGFAAMGACGVVLGTVEAVTGAKFGEVFETLGGGAGLLVTCGPSAARILRARFSRDSTSE